MSQDPREPNLPPTAQPQQQPYPQAQPYPQPQQPYGYPGQAAQPTAHGQAYPPGQAYSGYAAAPYGALPAYPANPYATAPAKPRSAVLGIIGFAIVAIAGAIIVMLGLSVSGPMAAIMSLVPPGTTQIDPETIPPELMEQLAGPMTGMGMASFAGFVGWIVSIVATVTKRGRGWGVAGIILGIIAPVAALIAMSVAVLTALS